MEKGANLSNLAILIIFFIVVWLIAFHSVNLEENETGELSGSSREKYGTTKNNPLSIITANFIHGDTAHLVNNVYSSIIVLFSVMFAETYFSDLKTISVWWVLTPLLLTNFCLFSTWGNTLPGVGGSLFNYCIQGFLMGLGPFAVSRVDQLKNAFRDGIRDVLEGLSTFRVRIDSIFKFMLLLASVWLIVGLLGEIMSGGQLLFAGDDKEVPHLVSFGSGLFSAFAYLAIRSRRFQPTFSHFLR